MRAPTAELRANRASERASVVTHRVINWRPLTTRIIPSGERVGWQRSPRNFPRPDTLLLDSTFLLPPRSSKTHDSANVSLCSFQQKCFTTVSFPLRKSCARWIPFLTHSFAEGRKKGGGDIGSTSAGSQKRAVIALVPLARRALPPVCHQHLHPNRRTSPLSNVIRIGRGSGCVPKINRSPRFLRVNGRRCGRWLDDSRREGVSGHEFSEVRVPRRRSVMFRKY